MSAHSATLATESLCVHCQTIKKLPLHKHANLANSVDTVRVTKLIGNGTIRTRRCARKAILYARSHSQTHKHSRKPWQSNFSQACAEIAGTYNTASSIRVLRQSTQTLLTCTHSRVCQRLVGAWTRELRRARAVDAVAAPDAVRER
jgi:hypothetical protein